MNVATDGELRAAAEEAQRRGDMQTVAALNLISQYERNDMTETQAEYKLSAENVGPVRKLDVKVHPGLNVLRGANGSGKSTVLDAVQFAMTKAGPRPTPRDGTRAGKLEAFGVTATFTSRATLKGNLVVESLSGKLDIGDLISPGYEDEAVNDDRRTKRLIELSGAEATISQFAPLLNGMKLGNLPTDLVDAADWVKRLLQQQAREKEQQAEQLAANANAAKLAAEGVDLDAETDQAALQEQYVKDAANLSTLSKERSIVSDRLQKAAAARIELDAAKAIPGLTVHQAAAAADLAEKTAQQRATEVDEAEKRLVEAREKLRAARVEQGHARERYEQAQQRQEMIAAWESQVAEAESLKPISDEEIAAAKAVVQQARAAIEAGVLARKAKEQLAAAADFDESAKKAAADAEQLRKNASATDDVLAAELERIGCPWKPIDVPKGSGTIRRLVVKHRRGEQTLVSDLSEGERARDAIDVALGLAGKSDRPAVLILRQEVFEGLQPRVRALIDKHARQRGVVILTAEATDEEEVTL